MIALASPTDLIASWQAWQDARWASVSAEHGIASLVDTAWLYPQEQSVPDVAGTWRAAGDTVIGEGLGRAGYTRTSGEPVEHTVTLQPDETLLAGRRLLRAFVRDGVPALRIFDPDAEGRTTLTGLDAYEPNAAWIFRAHFEPATEPLVFELVDGHRSVSTRTGTLVFDHDGVERRLTATVGTEALSLVFGDQTSGVETYRFRFLRADLPDADGSTTLDLTRAFLPPCAFSPHYVCPLPPPGNRLEIAVTAGEKLPLRRAS